LRGTTRDRRHLCPIASFLCFVDYDFYLHSFTSLICQLF
jgi:hypothetical protein